MRFLPPALPTTVPLPIFNPCPGIGVIPPELGTLAFERAGGLLEVDLSSNFFEGGGYPSPSDVIRFLFLFLICFWCCVCVCVFSSQLHLFIFDFFLIFFFFTSFLFICLFVRLFVFCLLVCSCVCVFFLYQFSFVFSSKIQNRLLYYYSRTATL